MSMSGILPQATGLVAGGSLRDGNYLHSCGSGLRTSAKMAPSDQQSFSWHATMLGFPHVRKESNVVGHVASSRSNRGVVRVSAAGRPPAGVSTSQGGPGQDLYLPFRPPVEDTTTSLSNDEKLEILRERRGLWHEYAPLVTSLHRAGYTPAVLDELTGMNGVEQNIVVVAEQVYASLQTSGLLPESVAHFDVGGAEVLYELRILSIEQRKVAAEYVIEERLDAKGALQVARAIKEHERRKAEEGRDTFSTTPGDCLAFSHYRQSKEMRSKRDKEAWLEKALEVAVTESARRTIERALGVRDDKEAAPEAPAVVARIDALRLFKQETAIRPVPVAGNFEGLSVATLFRTSSDATVDGAFGVFTPTAGARWVALPAWSTLLSAKRPIAIEVPDTKKVPTFESKASSEALLVVDRGNDDSELQLESYYLVANTETGTGLILVSGSEAVDRKLNTLGKVLLILLPPQPEEDEEPADWE